MIGCGFGIYFANYYSVNHRLREQTPKKGGVLLIPDDYIPIWIFFINYLPTIVITLVNNVIPEIFDLFAQWEDRQPRPELKLKLVRLVILRISALCVLLWSIKAQIGCEDPDECGRCEPEHAFDDKNSTNIDIGDGDPVTTSSPGSKSNKIMCWETYLGQQMWRIIIADFLANFLVAFVMEPIRNFIAKYCCPPSKINGIRQPRTGLCKMIGNVKFLLERNVLHLVYLQIEGQFQATRRNGFQSSRS